MPYDVIIVLGGGINKNGGLPKPVINRIYKAQELFNEKLAPIIIMSGRWSPRLRHRPIITEAQSMEIYAHSLGLPKSAILKEEQSGSTLKNAQYLKDLFLTPHHWCNIIVVTSGFHLPRTQYIFDKILGPAYQISYISAPSVSGLSHRLRERFLLSLTKKYFSYKSFFATS
jgi:uncharacterized SAM-binding protein YcdF (DUF218 family)